MNELSVQQILKDILADNVNLLNSRDELINLLKQKTPSSLARELSVVQKALQCNIGEYFLKAHLSQDPSDKIYVISEVNKILAQENIQESSINKVVDTFVQALGWTNTKAAKPATKTQIHYDKSIEKFDVNSFNKELSKLKNQVNALERNHQLILEYLKANQQEINRLRTNIELFLNNTDKEISKNE